MSAASRLTTVWSILLLLTAGSFALGIEQSRYYAAAATILIIGVALLKVWLIGRHFMDLRAAPRVLRTLFDVYVAVVFLTLSVLSLPIGS